MDACSCSKAIAAFSEPEFQDCIVLKNLRQYTNHTKTSQAEVYAEFKKIAERGFVDGDQEIDMGISSVADRFLLEILAQSLALLRLACSAGLAKNTETKMD